MFYKTRLNFYRCFKIPNIVKPTIDKFKKVILVKFKFDLKRQYYKQIIQIGPSN